MDGKVKKWFTQEHNCDCIANLYESKLHPMLRFLHEKNINSCGWVEINVNPTKAVNHPNANCKCAFEQDPGIILFGVHIQQQNHIL